MKLYRVIKIEPFETFVAENELDSHLEKFKELQSEYRRVSGKDDDYPIPLLHSVEKVELEL